VRDITYNGKTVQHYWLSK